MMRTVAQLIDRLQLEISSEGLYDAPLSSALAKAAEAEGA